MENNYEYGNGPYPTNESWLLYINSESVSDSTKKQYSRCVLDYYNYCLANNAAEERIFEAATVQIYLENARKNGSVCLVANKKKNHAVGDLLVAKGNQLFSRLSGIKKYFSFFNKPDPCIARPIITTNLKLWVSEDPESDKSLVFEEGTFEFHYYLY